MGGVAANRIPKALASWQLRSRRSNGRQKDHTAYYVEYDLYIYVYIHLSKSRTLIYTMGVVDPLCQLMIPCACLEKPGYCFIYKHVYIY